MTFQSFEDLNCWKACRELRNFIISEIVPLLPKHEFNRLCDQMIRASRSTTANIAEGYSRFHFLDNAKFCSNARGSCWEILDHLITSHDEKYITKEQVDKGRQLVYSAIKLLNGYMSYLKRANQNKYTSVKESLEEYNQQ